MEPDLFYAASTTTRSAFGGGLLRKALVIILVALLLPAASVARAAEAHQSVGLVLSGGGAKGIAHAGFIQALEENDIPIDYVTGTSMGSIVGGLYACGYTPAEMMQLFTSEYFANISTGTVDPSLTYYFTRQQPSSQLFAIPVGADKKSRDVFNPQSVVNPMPMDFAFMQIFAPYTAQCDSDFNRLFVPFRCVASDVEARHKKVLRKGSLGASIHASMSFPLIFQATRIDSVILYDGGIYDNFPVDVMRSDFAPSIMIGVDVSTSSPGQPNSFMQQLELLVMQNQSYALPDDEGIKVHIDLSEFSLLDFPKAQAIYDIGYQRGHEMIDSIKSRIHRSADSKALTIRRNIFKAHTPHLHFDSVRVTGGTRQQNRYLEYLFSPRHRGDTIGESTALLSFYRAVSSGKFSMLHPTAHFNRSTGLFSLRLDSEVKPPFSAGVGAYITSTNNSYLYLRGEYNSLSFRSINTSVEAWIGQSYMAGVLRGKLLLHWRVPASVFVEGVATRRRYYESEELFFRDSDPAFVAKHEYFGKLGFSIAAGRSGAVCVGIGGGRLYNSFLNSLRAELVNDSRDRAAMNMGQIFATYRSSTLNDVNYPTAGRLLAADVAYARGKTFFGPSGKPMQGSKIHFLQANVAAKAYLSLHKHWSLGLEGNAVLSTRRLLGDYYATVSMEPAFQPTPASTNAFRAGFRANSFVAAGLVPVYSPVSNLSLRLNAYAFAPLRATLADAAGNARYGKWFGSVCFYGEFAACYHLPFANVAAYCNYDGDRHRFSGGISLGLYIPAPTFF